MLSGWLFLLIGLAIIVHLPVALVVKILLVPAWIADTVNELLRQARGQARVRHLTLDSLGQMTCHDSSGRTRQLRLLNGSVVLRRWAWLRLGFDDGLHYVEWLWRGSCAPQAWRRLQIVWRHGL